MYQLWQYVSHLKLNRRDLDQDIFSIIFSNQLAAALTIMHFLLAATHLILGDVLIGAVRVVNTALFMLIIWLNKNSHYNTARHLLMYTIASVGISSIWVTGVDGNYRLVVILMLFSTALVMRRLVQYGFYTLLGIVVYAICYYLAPRVTLLVEPQHVRIYTLVNNIIITALGFLFVFFVKQQVLNHRQQANVKQRMLRENKEKIEEQNRVLQKAYDRIHTKEAELLRTNAQLTREVKRSNRLKREQSYALSLLETTLESTPYSIWVTNKAGETERFNQQFIRLWGINGALAASDDRVLLNAFLKQVCEPEIFKTKLAQIQLHPAQKSQDLIYFRDGRVVERYSRPHLHRNQVVGRVWTFLDVTTQKRTEEKLVAANQELQQFASVASHDMKEPLRTISSFSTLLSRRIPDQSDAREYLHFIKDAAGRMTNLLEDLINYARAGRLQEQLKPISLERILLLVQNNLHSTIQQNEVVIKMAKLPTVMGQSTPFIQLFQNLIANAIKFQQPNNQPVINIELAEMGDYWQIAVRDNGIGMATEYLERIFQPFTRLHSQAEYQGSGIGLATCAKIVQHFGGRIWVSSELGVGTIFYFTVPKITQETTTELPLELSLRN